MLDDQLELIYNSSALVLDVAWKICWQRWTIETNGEKRSGKSELLARQDDNDDIYIYIYIYIAKMVVEAVQYR